MGFFLPNWTNYKHIYRMKKILIFTALMTAVINTNAQLQVNSDGNVLIGSNATTYAKLNTAGSTTNIRAKRTGEANSTAPTIEATCNISSPEWAIGVKGFGSGTNGAMNFGAQHPTRRPIKSMAFSVHSIARKEPLSTDRIVLGHIFQESLLRFHTQDISMVTYMFRVIFHTQELC